MTRRFTLATLLVIALAVPAAYLTQAAELETVFQAPGTVQLLHDKGVGVSRDLSSFRGQLRAKARLWLVFRWLLEPVRIEAEEPVGHLELLLGEPNGAGATLRLNPEQVVLQVRGPAAQHGWRLPRPPGERFALSYREGAYEVLVDGSRLGEPRAGPAPVGPARALLRSSAGVAALSCVTADGEQRRIAGERSVPFAQRGTWAAGAALLAMLALGALAGGGRGPWVWLLALLLVGLVGQGLLLQLIERNRERLLALPADVASTPWEQAGAAVLRPGAPLDLAPRRDADFELSARVRLAPDSALDVLLRADDSSRDRGLVLGLSTDARLPGGLSRNLGTFFETTLAPPTWRVLAPQRSYALDVSCAGSTTTVRLDGELYATLDDLDLRAGRLAFHVLAGEAELQALSLQPRAASHEGARLLRWCVGVGSALLVGVALLVLLLSGAPAGALWLWPLGVSLLPWAPSGLVVPGLLVAASLLALLLFWRRRQAAPLAAVRRLLAAFAGTVVLATAGWAWHQQAPVLTPALLNDLRPTDVFGPALPRAYAWARHPLLRRFNPYVRTQRFRERAVAFEPTPGRTRILCAGSSSTFGYGVQAEQAFPARLERALALLGLDAEVLNAGVPGSNAPRLLLSLEGLLLAWKPDVVIVNLGFNDHNRGSVHDEQAHFRAMTTTGIGWPQHLLDLFAARSDERGYNEFFAKHQAGQRDDQLLERFNTLPARRYGDTLRELVGVVRAAGAEPVFVLEPPNPAEDTGLMPAFHAAMAEVAAGAHVPLADPAPVLAPQVEEMYIDVVHLTVAGHERMAGLLARTLVDAGWLPR